MRLALLALFSLGAVTAADEGWITMFDGKTLTGWKADQNADAWTVKDGSIVGDGEKGNLFWTVRELLNFDWKAEVKINDGGNSGMFFRKGFGPGGAKGYEAQINSTHRDPKKTGGLYNFKDIYEQLVPPDTWFTQEVIVDGNHVIIKVNGKVTVDYVEDTNRFSKSGYLALQQHNKGSVVSFRNMMLRPIPSDH